MAGRTAGERGHALRAFVFVMDVTALKESQKDVARAEAKFRTIVECAPEAFLMVDAGSGLVVEANRRAEALFGRSIGQIVGMHVSELTPSLEWAWHLKRLQAHQEQEIWATSAVVVSRGGGKRVPVSVQSCLASIQEGPRVLMMLRETYEALETQDVRDGAWDAGQGNRAGARELEKLSRRECEVVRLVAEGLTNRQIAKRLFLSIKTVETHRSRIMDKLGFHKAADIVRFAVRTGLCGEPPRKA